jgi:hypothetical protein
VSDCTDSNLSEDIVFEGPDLVCMILLVEQRKCPYVLQSLFSMLMINVPDERLLGTRLLDPSTK